MTSDDIDYLSVDDLVILAETILGRRPVVRDPGLLAAAAARPGAVLFGQTAYPTLFGKAAALLFSICQNHALLDGNKRLAWAAAVTFLALNGVAIPDIDVDAAEAFMLAVAKGELTEVAHIEARLIDLYGG
ncbi:type II toxin-antitoxin system death-on-curing family toxin [Allorhizocola rhizosphaerae]|uniref:type II toxin-antitoxin system death-on-curing family toxin n=1 Tax=Allorhizocola rhizosphaerae TaxID=1872709 RepID=UPI000E3E3C21|nr:type II toxin-antitoxin system death-on-curing family toxin [Allorhizocola rhizosphaerae]